MKHAALGILALAAACAPAGPHPAVAEARALFEPEVLRRVLRASPAFPPEPHDPTNAVADDPRAFALGRALFHDPGLSADGRTSCATCHDPGRGWTNPANPKGLDVDAPSLWNAALARWYFWDGRADSLWAQALQPLEHPREHGLSRLEVARHLAGSPALRARYEELFGPLPPLEDEARFPRAARPVPDDPRHAHARAWSAMTEEDRRAVDRVFSDVGKALAAFETRIVSFGSPFDRFVRGLRTNDPAAVAALGADARRGAALFFGRANCHLCHSGPLLSDQEFHDVRAPLDGPRRAGRYDGIQRVVRDPFNGVGAFSDDPGDAAREKLAYLGRPRHAFGEFKTPGLRDVARTAPYMHAGAFASLEEVVEHYSTLADAAPPSHAEPETVLRPLHLTEEEKRQLVAFLESLTLPPPAESLRAAHENGDTP